MKGTRREGTSAWLPKISDGSYADGMPLDQMRYLQCKVILKPNHFTSRSRLFAFAKILKRPAREGIAVEP